MVATSFVNGVVFTPVSTGTVDFVVSAAVTGWQTPAAAGAVDGATYRYRAASTDNTQWETGTGVYTVSTTTLTRATVSYNSLGTTAKISFTAAPQVSMTVFGQDITANSGLVSNQTGIYVNANNGISANSTGTFAVGANGITITAAGINVLSNNGISSNTTGVWAVGANAITITSTGINVVANNGLIANTTGIFVIANNGLISNSTGVFVNANSGLIANSTGVFVNANTGITANSSGLFAAGMSVYTANVGDASTTTFAVTHNLNKTNMVLTIRDQSTGYYVYPDVIYTNTNSCSIIFSSAPTANQYFATLVGT